MSSENKEFVEFLLCVLSDNNIVFRDSEEDIKFQKEIDNIIHDCIKEEFK